MSVQRVNGVNGVNGVNFGTGLASVVLGWIARYGLPTVFALILLAYLLYDGQVDNQRAAAIGGQVLEQQRVLGDQQREIARTLVEVSRTLERLNARLDVRPVGGG